MSSTGAPVFSYAQAAKGLASAAPTQSTSRNESPAASEKSAKDRSIGESTSTSSVLKSPRLRSEAGDRSSGDSAISTTSAHAEVVVSTSVTPDDVTKDGATQNQHAPAADNESSQAPHVDATSNPDAQRDEVAQQLPIGRKASSDDSPMQDQETPNASEKKSKDGEDDWEKVSVPSIPAETQYKAAPIPSVNVWQVRREAQAAKMKEHQKPAVSTASNPPRKTRSVSDDFK